MTTPKHLNLVRQNTSTTGTGPVLLDGAALYGQETFQGAGAVDGTLYEVVIRDGTAYELVRGVYTAGAPAQFSRDTVLASSEGGAKISLSGNATIYSDASAEFFEEVIAQAKAWAETPEDTEVEPGEYSARHHAAKAAGSESNAATSASNAQTARDEILSPLIQMTTAFTNSQTRYVEQHAFT